MVHNKATPKGSIAEGYLANKLATFCLIYLENTSTIHNRPQRNSDEAKWSVTRVILYEITLLQVHWYILFNLDDFLPLWKWVLIYEKVFCLYLKYNVGCELNK
jgi:hypothetical protein